MELSEKIARLVMIDFAGTELPGTAEKHVTAFPWGGFVLFAKNVSSLDQVIELNRALSRLSTSPPLIAVDQEGGTVSRLGDEKYPPHPGAMALGAGGSVEITRGVHRVTGELLRALGFNMNFAPVLDVNSNPENPIIGVRSFGEDPETVSNHGIAALQGLAEGGVIPVGKHFPGHGDTQVDSHFGLPTVAHEKSRLLAMELRPFQEAVRAGLLALMTAHILFPALDSHFPATLSEPILTGLLRGKMGFGGVVITDSMAMKAISSHFGTKEATLLAFKAGADMILACGTEEEQMRTFEALRDGVSSGEVPEERIDKSLERIENLKKALPKPFGELPPSSTYGELMRSAALSSIRVIKNQGDLIPLRLKSEDKLLVVQPLFLPESPMGGAVLPVPLGQHLWEGHPLTEEHRFSITEEKILMDPIIKGAEEAAIIVAALYGRGTVPPAQKELARALIGTGKPVILISLNHPGLLAGFPEARALVCSYNHREPTIAALSEVLRGESEALTRGQGERTLKSSL
ncbi:MAG: beta-N-acetylhexosaminidase [Armatimonadetes bacterium]|nr:beta-N-acetylhexosaminidase [Armatimonadota bacterium]